MSAAVNQKLELARNFVLHTNRNVFLTGKAGTGKTTFLHSIKYATGKRLVVVAPTGVAAINAGGVTIHSFFQLPFGPLVPGSDRQPTRKFTKDKLRLIRTLDLLVIDEISMVRADVLDGIDAVLRRYRNPTQPFGGVQLLMIGDMQQLPPVIRDEDWALLRPYYETGYFFGSRALQQIPYVSIELTHIYRQSDEQFIGILNAIREKKITAQQLQVLNARHQPDFRPTEELPYITLSTHNSAAQQINSQRLDELDEESQVFTATIDGEFPAHAFPTEAELELKVGAQVMFVKNDISREKRYFNGKIGRITEIDEDVIYVRCPQDEEEISVTPVSWENIRYGLDPGSQEIRADVIGTFSQYPLKLAWAITIHKSQGLTFERAIIDAAAAFTHGQVYVALSRCKTLEGIVLSAPIPSSSIKNEWILDEFHQEVQQKTPTEREYEESKRAYQETLLQELFSFRQAAFLLQKAHKVVRENASSLDADLMPAFEKLEGIFLEKAVRVTERFERDLARYFSESCLPEENQPLQERIGKASLYFKEILWQELLQPLHRLPTGSDNQQVRTAMLEAVQEFEKELNTKLSCFERCRTGFESMAYLKARNEAELSFKSGLGKAAAVVPAASAGSEAEGESPVAYPGLYRTIVRWRDALAAESDVKGYMVLPRKTILELANGLPQTLRDLEKVKGIGKLKARQFGPELLELIQLWCEENDVQPETF
ncbi:HRDC domain-containing protein [Tellurirhabdus rosea]|uniref:HRDC domain-containing protein n=1 Tax=Tellurirhabdus rosea TaxID=2674997 RepID=UPI00225051A4|nr:HRDC domain-containing protein [Tellurirhabdus rosea]